MDNQLIIDILREELQRVKDSCIESCFENRGNMALKPMYKHDCDSCEFIGTWRDYPMTATKYDLYYCPEEDNVVARFGSAGEQYISGINFYDTHKAIKEAVKRAVIKGRF